MSFLLLSVNTIIYLIYGYSSSMFFKKILYDLLLYYKFTETILSIILLDFSIKFYFYSYLSNYSIKLSR